MKRTNEITDGLGEKTGLNLEAVRGLDLEGVITTRLVALHLPLGQDLGPGTALATTGEDGGEKSELKTKSEGTNVTLLRETKIASVDDLHEGVRAREVALILTVLGTEGGAEGRLVERDARAEAVKVVDNLGAGADTIVADQSGREVEGSAEVLHIAIGVGRRRVRVGVEGEELSQDVVLGIVDGVAEELRVSELRIGGGGRNGSRR